MGTLADSLVNCVKLLLSSGHIKQDQHNDLVKRIAAGEVAAYKEVTDHLQKCA